MSDIENEAGEAVAAEAAPAPAPAPAENAPAENALIATIDRIIDEWFVGSMHGSIVSRSTETYNHVQSAVLKLKARLIDEARRHGGAA
jgi:Na+/alanine symporter